MALRLAFRTLLRSRWHAVAAIGTIALTISLSATVFAVVDGVLFRPLPYPDSGRLYFVNGADAKGRGGYLSALDVRYLADADARIGVTPIGLSSAAANPDQPHLSVTLGLVGPNFFDVLGMRPLMGGFQAEHFATLAPGAARPAILTYQAWRRWLPDLPNPIGHTLELPGARLAVVGVLSPDFVSVFGGISECIGVTPLITTPEAAADRWARDVPEVLVRLPSDLALADTVATLTAALAARANEYPIQKDESGMPYVGVRAQSVSDDLGAVTRRKFTVGFLASVVLLLLGALNVTALTVARAGDRAREFGLRAALGAPRRALVTLWLTEAMTVAVIGGLAGLALALVLVQVAHSLLPWSTQLPKPPMIDLRAAVFAGLAAIVPLLFTTLVPAISASRRAVMTNLASGGRGTSSTRSWSRGALLAAETAIGMTLVLVGSLILGGYLLLRSEDVGFDTRRLAIVELARVRGETREIWQAREMLAFERIRQSPGVRDVAIVGVPFHGRLLQIFTTSFAPIKGSSGDAGSPSAYRRVYEVPVSGAFFDLAGLRLVTGRYPTRAEIDAGHPVVVINEQAARAYFADRPVLGQPLSDGKQTLTVVGVVELAQVASQVRQEFAQIYFPIGLKPAPQRRIFLVQTDRRPEPVAVDIGIALKRDIPGALLVRAESFDQALVKGEPGQRFDAMLYGVAGGAALLLVTVGVTGLVATAVARRVREMGIRTALGARPAQLVRLVVTTQLRPVLVGVTIGLIASWWTTKLVRAYRYDSHDPRVWAAAVAILLGAALIAAWLPARRASRVDPTVALRAE